MGMLVSLCLWRAEFKRTHWKHWATVYSVADAEIELQVPQAEHLDRARILILEMVELSISTLSQLIAEIVHGGAMSAR